MKFSVLFKYSNMEVVTTKILSLIFLGLGTVIFGFIPLKLSNFLYKKETQLKKNVISVLLCFGGGLLFAICLIHLMPEVS